MIVCAAGDIHGAIDRLYQEVLSFEESLGVRFIEEAVSRMASSSPESYHEDLIIEVKRWYLEHGDHSSPVNVMIEIVDRVIAEREHPSSEAG